MNDQVEARETTVTQPRKARRWGSASILIAFVIVAVAAVAWFGGAGGGSTPPAPSTAARTAAIGSRARFTYLAAQHSNYCSLDRATVSGYADVQHMQGACCDAMDMDKYQHQVAALRQYSGLAEIPTDPYDIRAKQAKRLLADDTAITLAGADKATYDRAMKLTDDKGPCCCQCWRWYMTQGLDKALITRRQMSAQQVAEITDLVNGCGGPLGSTPTDSGMQPSS